MSTDYRFLGKRRPMIEGPEKVSGRTQYTGDLVLPRMLHARPVLSPYAHANILSIDATKARAVPGVVAVLTDQDLPTRNRPLASRNSAVLARERVVYQGQPVVLVVGETEEAATDGAALVEIDYEPLEAIVDPEKAMQDDSPLVWPDGIQSDEDMASMHAAVDRGEEEETKPSNIHGHLHFQRGDAEAGLAASDVVVRRTYRTPSMHQGYLEPHASVADYDAVRKELTVHTSTQGQYSVRDELAKLLGLSRQRVRVIPMTVGGGFGAKYGIIDPLTAGASMVTGRPVRMVLSRTEDFLATTPAPASTIELQMGSTAAGVLNGLKARVVIDNGAFSMSLGGIMGVLIGGYYKCANVDIECFDVITNKLPAGAYRAPGAPPTSFALETAMDDIASQLGLDPLEFRMANAAGDGDLMGNGDPWPSLGLRECLERVREHPIWRNRKDAPDEGVGLALGAWPGAAAPAAAICRVQGDGTVQVNVGSVDISGLNSSLVLVAAEVLQVHPDKVELVQGDTRGGLFAGASGGSQTTYSVSTAVRAAAEEARRQLLHEAADKLEVGEEDLEVADGDVQVKGAPTRRVSIPELAASAESRRGGAGPITGDGRSAMPSNAPGAAAHLCRVRVDRETGEVTLLEYASAQDIGFAMNPMMVEGQIQGGTVQGMGWGLHEAMVHDADGQLITASFLDYALPSIDVVSDIDVQLVEKPSEHGLNGARIVGEPPVVPGAGAIANAIFHAVGIRLNEIPMTPERVLAALND
ncbi:MAG TPA: xanthine dehydrogenase family protein molybdopterin-binding subunit [Candidatus Dormibacteraeota bacterium]|jgi:CO/xanthine dehydrogenase Mo-binding subunit|nr:xanthine dehydrogenase family protein molybdopterin-binding subunit [Candidatus Dormibacteraeota bacterium]